MFLFRDPRHHHVHITDALLLTSAFVNRQILAQFCFMPDVLIAVPRLVTTRSSPIFENSTTTTDALLFRRLYQLSGGGSPYGLQVSLCTLRVSCSDIRYLLWWIVDRADSQCPLSIRVIPTRFPGRASAIHATLDTGDWLGLTRRGLAPRKMRQASLGALTQRSLAPTR